MTLVEQLVRVYSPSGHVKDVSELLQRELAARGFKSQIDEAGNIVGVIGHGPTRIYLVGHIDTVMGEIPVRVENGVLHGRGSVDAKGPLAAFVEAAAKFAQSEQLEITVIACPDEEAESEGALHILNSHNPADYVVIGEPSGWDAMTLGYKGSLVVDYALEQPNHHMGADSLTSAEAAIKFYQVLCDTEPNTGFGFEALSINLKSINTSSDGLSDRVQMHLNIRTPLEFNAEEFKAHAEDIRGDAQLRWSQHLPAVLSDKKSPLVRAFLGAIRAHDGAAKFKRKTGTSDMNVLAGWGCPILAYGPGDSKLDHTPYEHLVLADYEQAIEVLVTMLKGLEK